MDAVFKGQRLRAANQLVEAKEQLRICAAESCPEVVQTDCVDWLADVERALPTVVVTAKSGAGMDLVGVSVTVDGRPFLDRLDGAARPMNAGLHAFHFASTDGTSLDREVRIKEGEKNQSVDVVLATPKFPPSPMPLSPPERVPPPSLPPEMNPYWRVTAWALGTAGIAGLVTGAAFGIAAAVEKNADCQGSACAKDTTSRIRTNALISDIGWISGSALLDGCLAVVLFAPKAKPSTALRLTPLVGPGGAIARIEGNW